MESAVLRSALNILGPKIIMFLQEYHKLQRDLKHDISYIQAELGFVAAAIEQHDDSQSWSHGIGVDKVKNSWIQNLRELAYDMEDCMDRYMHRVTREHGASALRQAVHRTTAVPARAEFAAKIRELKKKSVDLSKQRACYMSGADGSSTSGEYSWSPTLSSASDLVGMDEPREELLEIVWETHRQPNKLKVISILGFGGLGKTLLAKQVYDAVALDNKFEPQAWVHAAGKSARDVIKEIQDELGIKRQDEHCHINKLIRSIKTFLDSKRFFIVIDDIRTEYWNSDVKGAFPVDTGLGSIVIVTTAIQSIATTCSSGNGHVFVMRTLDEVHSKQLFLKEASLQEDPPGSETVLKKCNGLPLALVSTAQFLQSKGHLTPLKCAKLWEHLGEHLETADTLGRMKHVLVHNYMSLPGHILKTCLLYLGIFPSGHPVKRKRLIRRWLAEGFVEGDHTRSSLDVAVENFEELINRSIIQPVDVSNNTEVKTCRTHGMMLEFILRKSISENFISLLYDKVDLPNKIRRLSLHHDSAERARRNSGIDLSLVRSLTIFGEVDKDVLKFSDCELLRVLDLEECNSLEDEHVKNICELILLRYLSLGGVVTMLPKEISKLKFLEALDLRRTKIKILPIEVIKLPCLIHLLGMFELQDSGQSMRKLQTFLSEKSKLETLAGFLAENDQGFPQLMKYMHDLASVKIRCKSTAGSNLVELSKAIQDFIQSGTDANVVRSLSLDSGECSQESLLNFSLQGSSCYLSSLKLKGKMFVLPQFVTMLAGLTELCLSSSVQLGADVLAALSSVRCLYYLKLIACHLDKFVIGPGALGTLRCLCIVVKSMAEPEIQEGALPRVESIQLLCKDLKGLCGIRIEYLKRLEEVTLDDGVDHATKGAWKEAARKHPRWPKVLFLKTEEEVHQVQMVPTESSASAAPAPAADVEQMKLNEGSEPFVEQKKHTRIGEKFAGLFHSRAGNGERRHFN